MAENITFWLLLCSYKWSILQKIENFFEKLKNFFMNHNMWYMSNSTWPWGRGVYACTFKSRFFNNYYQNIAIQNIFLDSTCKQFLRNLDEWKYEQRVDKTCKQIFWSRIKKLFSLRKKLIFENGVFSKGHLQIYSAKSKEFIPNKHVIIYP